MHSEFILMPTRAIPQLFFQLLRRVYGWLFVRWERVSTRLVSSVQHMSRQFVIPRPMREWLVHVADRVQHCVTVFVSAAERQWVVRVPFWVLQFKQFVLSVGLAVHRVWSGGMVRE